MARLLSFTLVLAMVSSTWCRSAAAEPAQPRAEDVAKQARRAYVLGKLGEAITGFGYAYELSGDASLLFDLAEAQREAGRPTDALRSYQTYLRRAPSGIYRKNAERQIRELKKTLAPPALERAAIGASGSAGSKAGAGVVKGAPPGTPLRSASTPPAVISPPAATGESRAKDDAPAPSTPPAQETRPRAIAVAPAAASIPAREEAPPAPRPLLPLPPTVAGTVGERAPTRAPTLMAMPAAPQPSVSEHPGTDLLATGTEAGDASRSAAVPTWVPIALAVTTVALGAVAIATGLSASHRYDDLKSHCAPPNGTGCTTEEIDDQMSLAHRANLFWAATGLAAAGFGTTLYFHLRDQDQSTPAATYASRW